MLYLITGKLLSLKSYSLYFSVCHLEDLETIENLFGWFLLEHVFEEYETTPGKLFIIYEDFRTLMVNSVRIVRNLLFVVQFFTGQEFFFVNFLLILLIIINKKTLKFNNFKFFLTFIYLNVLNSFFFLSISNIFYASVSVIFVYLLISCVINYLFLVYWYVFIQLTSKKVYNLCLKIISIKLVAFIVIFLVCLLLFLFYLNSYAKINDNLALELVIKSLIIYLYKYRII